MTEKHVLVRPVFLRASLAVFLMLLPLVTYATWDYIELHRLETRARQIAATGEPISEEEALRSETPMRPISGAYRFYEAAAALMYRTGSEPDDPSEALRLLDRAIELPFDGFPPAVARSSYFVGNLRMLQVTAGRRTVGAVDRGDPEAAL